MIFYSYAEALYVKSLEHNGVIMNSFGDLDNDPYLPPDLTGIVGHSDSFKLDSYIHHRSCMRTVLNRLRGHAQFFSFLSL